MIKVGVIGAGNMGKNHIRLLRELSDIYDLCAVYDPDEERLRAQNAEGIRASSEEELIDRCDAVVIAAPSSLHKKIALQVAAKEKHLLVEKPLALSAEDANEIVSAYRSLDKVLMVGHVERFNPTITELEKVIGNEKIIAVNIERCSPADTRIVDTDVVYDLMIHDVDILLNAIFPAIGVSKISAVGTKAYSPSFMDYVDSMFEFENGCVGSIIASRATESKLRRIDIHCRDSFIMADLLDRKISVLRSTILKTSDQSSAYRQENVVSKVFVPNVEPLRAELVHFAHCIDGKETPLTSGESAVRSIETLDKIKKILYKRV